jgi:hypothetical protein
MALQYLAIKLSKVFNKHPEIWTDQGKTVHIPPEWCMPINLKDGWQNANMPSKSYQAGALGQKVK